MKRLLLSFIVSVFGLQMLSAQNIDSLWNQAVAEYAAGNYSAALDGFSAIEDYGYESAGLYYNIGNCYYKAGNYLGMSILYYRKALRLDPSFEDAKVNLSIAKESTLDRIDEIPEFILLTWIKSFRDTLSSDAWAWISLVSFFAIAVFVLLFRFGNSVPLRKTSFSLAAVCVLCMIISVIFALNLRDAGASGDEAVITVPVCSVKSTPGSSDQSLFILHEGTEVDVLDSIGGWYRIEIPDGRQGWIEKDDLGIV